MSSPKLTLTLTLTLIAALLVVSPLAEAVISCGQVASSVSTCIPYARGVVAKVPPACCSGIKSLNSAARTTPDRQATCNCLKNAAGQIPGLNLNKVAGLPGICGVNIPYKISPSTNCATVK